jgi:maltodextrin utilization protein YvdJ
MMAMMAMMAMIVMMLMVAMMLIAAKLCDVRWICHRSCIVSIRCHIETRGSDSTIGDYCLGSDGFAPCIFFCYFFCFFPLLQHLSCRLVQNVAELATITRICKSYTLNCARERLRRWKKWPHSSVSETGENETIGL